MIDPIDRAIVNDLQAGFPISHRPYAEVAARLGIDEADLLDRLRRMLDRGILTRFGPLFHAERLGGGLTLAAVEAPEDRFDALAAIVNAFPEVAHNYRREHRLNMWFVVATETPERISEVLAAISEQTGLKVFDTPKIEEFYIGLRLEA